MTRHPPVRRVRRSSRPGRSWGAALLGGALLVLGLPGCGLFGDDEGTAATTTPPTTTAAPDLEPELLDAGEAPRKELRLRFTPGTTTTVAIALDLDVTQESEGSSQALDTPVVTETVRFTVDEVDPTGADGPEAVVSFTFTAVALDRAGTDLTDAEHAELTADLQGLVGLGGTARITDRGALRSLAYTDTDTLDASVAATLEQFEDQIGSITVPLPVAPVGVGGRWRTTTVTTLAGVTLDQVTTHQVTGFTDTGLTYTTTTDQSAQEGDLDPEGLADGSTARLLSSDVTGTGTGTLDLGAVVGTGSSRLEGTQVLELTAAGGEPIRLTQRLDLGLVVKPAG